VRISNLPDDHLLDAAHIMADADELLGQPVIANGIALSKIHQSATGAFRYALPCAPAVHLAVA
jgi:putative restriction endonuclease